MLDNAISEYSAMIVERGFEEEVLQCGDGNQIAGILTLPRGGIAPYAPVFVFLNAGLLHRVGPLRMYVSLARVLAGQGFATLRVDLSGVGDSPARPGTTYRESVAADFAAIKDRLDARIGRRGIIVAGLCSAADNAIRLVLQDDRIGGLLLLDPICFETPDFRRKAAKKLLADKFLHPVHSLSVLKRQSTKFLKGKRWIDPLSLRDLPSLEQLKDAFKCLRERDGYALSIFTRYATLYYNHTGQLAEVLELDDEDVTSTEIFWPEVEHTFMLEVHRRRLIDTVTAWAVKRFAHSPEMHAAVAVR